MCSWVSLSGSNSDLHFSQRWEKSASTDSHTNFTWDDISRVGILTACFENTQPMSRTYSFIFNIILPASQNSHLCLISVVRLVDIGNFFYRKYLLPNFKHLFSYEQMKHCITKHNIFMWAYDLLNYHYVKRCIFHNTEHWKAITWVLFFTHAVEIILKDDCWPKDWPFLHIKAGITNKFNAIFHHHFPWLL